MIFDYRRRFFLVKIIFITCFLFTVLVLCIKMVKMHARKTSKEQTGAGGSNQHGTNSVSGTVKKRQQKPRMKRVSWSKSFLSPHNYRLPLKT